METPDRFNLFSLLRTIAGRLARRLPTSVAGSMLTATCMMLALNLSGVVGLILAFLVAGLGGRYLVALRLEREVAGGFYPGAADLRLAVSAVLVVLVLAFVFILTLATVSLVVIAIMSASGFDFDLASKAPDGFDQAFAAYRDTPGWQVAQGVFLFGLVAWLVAAARAMPFAAASLVTGRVIVLEAFNAARGQGLRLLASGSLIMAVPVAALVAARSFLSGAAGTIIATGALAALVFTATAWLAALDRLIPEPRK